MWFMYVPRHSLLTLSFKYYSNIEYTTYLGIATQSLSSALIAIYVSTYIYCQVYLLYVYN